jgi:hypothetical protein
MKKWMIKAIVLLIVLAGVGALIFQVSNYDCIVITEVQYYPGNDLFILRARYGGIGAKDRFSSITSDLIRQGAKIKSVTPIPGEDNKVTLAANNAGVIIVPAGVHITGEIEGRAFSLDITPGSVYTGIYRESEERFYINYNTRWTNAEDD